MDIYLSYKNIDFKDNFNDTNWEPISLEKKDIQINLLKLNFNLLKINFKNIYLITDKKSEKYFTDLNWSNIYTIFDNLDNQYLNAIPALSKLVAYKFAANQNKPFLHVDNDFFIAKKIKNDFLNSEVIAEKKQMNDPYLISQQYFIKSECKIEKLDFFNYYYNCGIIGGTNCNFFKKYASSAIDIITDRNNRKFFLDSKQFSRLDKSIIFEQIYYTSLIKEYNLKINLLFKEDLSLLDYISIKKLRKEIGCIHLIGPQKYAFSDIDSYIYRPEEFTKRFLL